MLFRHRRATHGFALILACMLAGGATKSVCAQSLLRHGAAIGVTSGDPTFKFPFESRVPNWSELPTSAVAVGTIGSTDGPVAVAPIIVRLPPVDDVPSPYAMPGSSAEPSPLAAGPASHWDGDDSVPGSFEFSQGSFRNNMRYVYDKTVLGFQEGTLELFIDYQNLISYRSIAFLGVSLAASASLANTPADAHIIHWSDQNLNGHFATRAAQDFKMFGTGTNTIPIFVVTAFTGPFLEETIPVAGPIGQWGNRSIQAIVAAGPMEIFFNQAIGSSRPIAGEGSKWRPFHDSHGVSGHAFMGSVFFLTASSVTEYVPAKVAFFLLSFGTAWSRVHDDQHYLSEVLMGWSIGMMGVDAVNRTKSGQNDFIISPAMLAGGTPGIQLAFNF